MPACSTFPVAKGLLLLYGSGFKKLTKWPECSHNAGPGYREGFSQVSVVGNPPVTKGKRSAFQREIVSCFLTLFSEGKKPNFNSSDSDLCIRLKDPWEDSQAPQSGLGRIPTLLLTCSVTTYKSLLFSVLVFVIYKMGTL